MSAKQKATKRDYVRGAYGPLGRLIAERLRDLNDTYPSLRLSLLGLANSVPMYRTPRGKKGQAVPGETSKFRDAQWLNAVMKADKGVRSIHKLEYDALFRILSTSVKPQTQTEPNKSGKRPNDFTVVRPLPEMSDVDENLYLRFVLALLDQQDLASHYMRALPFPDVQRLQNEMEGAEIWVFTNTMAESHDAEAAERTVDGILKGNKYRFFLPFGDEDSWRTGLERIKRTFGNRTTTEAKPDLDEHLKLFGISMLTVHSLTILNPQSDTRKAFISLGGWSAEDVQFVPLAAKRVEATIKRYLDVYNVGLMVVNPTTGPYGEDNLPQSGIRVKRFFPR